MGIFWVLTSLAIAAGVVWFFVKLLFLSIEHTRIEYMKEALDVQPIEKLKQKERQYKVTRIASALVIAAALARFMLGEESFIPNIISPDYQFMERFFEIFGRDELPQFLEYSWALSLFILIFALYMLIGSFIQLKRVRHEIENREKK